MIVCRTGGLIFTWPELIAGGQKQFLIYWLLAIRFLYLLHFVFLVVCSLLGRFESGRRFDENIPWKWPNSVRNSLTLFKFRKNPRNISNWRLASYDLHLIEHLANFLIGAFSCVALSKIEKIMPENKSFQKPVAWGQDILKRESYLQVHLILAFISFVINKASMLSKFKSNSFFN